MKRVTTLYLWLILTSCAYIQHQESATVDPSRCTVKIQAISANGRQYLGSGVLIATDTIATNCHIMRRSQQAFVIQPDRLYPILTQAALPEFDVCILKTQHLNLPATQFADSESVNIGDWIELSGYPQAQNLQITQAKIIALHPHGNAKIIEVNTGFNHGASGGGVFNSAGKLIGLMTFMGPEAGKMHFYAIPVPWLTLGLKQPFVPLKPFLRRSFWEKGDFVK